MSAISDRTVQTHQSGTAAPLHLTVRGRLVVVAVLVGLLLAAFAVGRSGTSTASATAGPGTAPVELGLTTVEAGETLWGVARRIAPGHDPRPVVQQIRELNDMGAAELQAGQQLLLPVAA